MADWNPELYLKFQTERTQPSLDLLQRIEHQNPMRILDAGCGPGNSTRVLVDRWPNAEIVGIDNSENMLEKAKMDLPNQTFLMVDMNDNMSSLGMFDVVFSNAVLQWLPNQVAVVNKLLALLNPNGVLAVQVPNMAQMPIRKVVMEVAGVESSGSLRYLEPPIWYDILAKPSYQLDMWETTYYHEMADHDAIVSWYSATGMKPYLEKLESELERNAFQKEVAEKLKFYYPIQSNGRVLFPFRRIFFVVEKCG